MLIKYYDFLNRNKYTKILERTIKLDKGSLKRKIIK